MQTHELKTLPVYWDAVKRGDKTFEVRRDDRGFQKGDRLALVRHDGRFIVAPGRFDNSRLPLKEKEDATVYAEIVYILTGGQFGIEPGYVVMGIRRIEA